MNINEALVEVGSAGAGLVAAQAAENMMPGYAGSGIALAAGGASWYFGPKWVKPAGAVMAGYGILSAVKKLAFKSSERRTGLLAKLEEALPGELLPAPGVQGLADAYGYDDSMLLSDGFDDEDTMMGFGNIEESLAGFGSIEDSMAGVGTIEDSLAGFGNLSEML